MQIKNINYYYLLLSVIIIMTLTSILYCCKIIILFDPNSISTIIIMILTFQITIMNKMYFLCKIINRTNWKNTSPSLIFYSLKTVKRTSQYWMFLVSIFKPVYDHKCIVFFIISFTFEESSNNSIRFIKIFFINCNKIIKM